MASHFQTEAWVNFGTGYRFVYQLWFGKWAPTFPFYQGNKSGPEGAVEIESRNLKKTLNTWFWNITLYMEIWKTTLTALHDLF